MFALQKTQLGKLKCKPQTMRKYLQTLFLTKGLYSEYLGFFFRKHIYTSQEDKQPDILNEQEI